MLNSLKNLKARRLLLIASCALSISGSRNSDTFVDPRDGHRYATVKIGEQVWMASNLAYAAPNSWCYGDDPADCAKNGRLYRWEAARIACPKGWHLPTDAEWMTLESHLGMAAEQVAATKARGTDQGAQLREGGSSGFNASISGYRRPDGSYARRGERAAFWVDTEADAENAWHRDIRGDVGTIYRSKVTKTYALSVRCICDKAVQSSGPISRQTQADVPDTHMSSISEFDQPDSKASAAIRTLLEDPLWVRSQRGQSEKVKR